MNDPGHTLQRGSERIAVTHILGGTIAQVEPTNSDPFVLEPRAKIPADQTGRARHQNHRLPCQITRPNNLQAPTRPPLHRCNLAAGLPAPAIWTMCPTKAIDKPDGGN